jgi:hypothetical protein
VFVGERRSRRAIQLGVRWEHGHLCARTLHAALRASGLDPAEQGYGNLYSDAEPPVLREAVLARFQALAADGVQIIGLGRIVHRALERAGVAHRRLIHPAARGAIRARAAYHAHVASVLGQAPAATADRSGAGNPPDGCGVITDQAHLLQCEEAC